MEPPARSLPARAPLLLLGLIAVLAACTLVPGATREPAGPLDALAEHQARWTSKGIDDYSFTITRQCFCPFTEPVEVTVVDGRATAMTKAGQPVEAREIQGLPTTMPELFAVVAAQSGAAELTVAWDPAFGFPTSIQVDSVANAIDDEFGFVVTDFRPAS